VDGVTQLHTLLDELEAVHRAVALEVEPRYEQAVANFPDPVGTMEEFERAIGQFASFVAAGPWPQGISSESKATGDRMHFDAIWPSVSGHFGNTYVAWKNVQSGREGGRRGFLNKLFDACLAWKTEAKVSALIGPFWRHYWKLEIEEKAVISDAYFARCRHLFAPESVSEDRYVRILNFRELIKKHAGLFAVLRDAGRRHG
jgi:hypothetical protein